jgi:hypothetical protein
MRFFLPGAPGKIVYGVISMAGKANHDFNRSASYELQLAAFNRGQL